MPNRLLTLFRRKPKTGAPKKCRHCCALVTTEHDCTIAAVGFATDSALLGHAIGGDPVGGMLGEMMRDSVTEPAPYSPPSVPDPDPLPEPAPAPDPAPSVELESPAPSPDYAPSAPSFDLSPSSDFGSSSSFDSSPSSPELQL